MLLGRLRDKLLVSITIGSDAVVDPLAKAKKARSKQVQEDTHIPTTSSYPTLSNTTQSYTPTMPSEPPLKKLRKKADPNAPQPEKRAAIFKKKCPQNILDRVERVMTQRRVVISHHFHIGR